MGNACYYSVEKLLSSSLLSKNLKVRIYKTVILPVLLYGCETWTLTLREEHRFRVFENKVLRKIFGAKRDEVTGEWRKLHNTELHALYSSPDIIRNIKSRRLRWAGHVARMGESRNAYRVLVGRLEGKRPLGRPRRRWEDNIKMYLREVGYDDRDWINLAQDRDCWRAYVRAAMNLRINCTIPVSSLIHEVTEHGNHASTTKSKIYSEKARQQNEDKRTCKICNKTYSRWYMKLHALTHTVEPLHFCEVCNKGYRYRCSLRAHMQTHQNKKYPCKICKKLLWSAQGLKYHLSLHTETKKFECEVCKKEFTFLNNLKIHSLIHSNEKQYKCDKCNKSFRHRSTIIQHMNVHMGVRPYKCKVCKKTFTQQTHLMVHTLIHTGERKHKCSFCDKTFVQSSQLKVHLKCCHLEQKPHKCHLCGVKFIWKHNYTDHMNAHKGIKPRECTVCDKRFIQFSALKSHMLLHTGDLPYECEVCGQKFRYTRQLRRHSVSHRKVK
ncbi:hypothetical protein ANN_00033 [Periplaneta americana]|uniref:C2H2-type domain-containing protein n=1 Tax=Periplaneta americana TaxID=6978 RepID=A0ABQ8TQQ7_PERAM|nr:hypothetical protein ANN_00033 [Periplaneta americana]